jgi:dienelactone hydrolase
MKTSRCTRHVSTCLCCFAAIALVACGGKGKAKGGTTADAGAAAAAKDSGGPSGSTAASTKNLSDGSYLCRPAGSGPFPAVLYNHGGKGDAVGGDLKGTCEALAKAGYVAHSEKRPATIDMKGHLDEVLAALAALRNNADVDKSRVGVMGFSRGGLLSLQVAVTQPDDVKAVASLAPAAAKTALSDTLKDAAKVTAPVRVYVSENDLYQDDHVQLAKDVESALKAAGKDVQLTIYPKYGSDGHMRFDSVQEPYWSDVMALFDSTLGKK